MTIEEVTSDTSSDVDDKIAAQGLAQLGYKQELKRVSVLDTSVPILASRDV